MSEAMGLDTPDHVAIRGCFAGLKGGAIVPEEREVETLAYLLRLVRNAPREITHGEEHKKVRDAVRTLLTVLPGMIESAEVEAADAKQDGRTTDLAHFAWRAQELLDAAQPFASVSASKRDVRGWWHGWARLIAQEVQAVLRQHGRAIGLTGKESPAIVVTLNLLALCRVEGMTASGLIEALKDRDRKVG
jgi:hypothetical protein